MDVFSVVLFTLIAVFVVFAVVVQVRARRTEKRLIERNEEIVEGDLPDPLTASRNATLWSQFHDRSKWLGQ